MKNLTFFIALLFVMTISCKKEEKEPEPVVGPTIVLDQLKVEKNVVGTWKGMIKGGGVTENVDVAVKEMKLGDKVADGRYYESSFFCGFEWTYESFANGKITFREKTLDPVTCYDNLAVIGYFQDEKFDILRLSISVPNTSYVGALYRQ